jgi:hypothetical protein
MDVTPGIRRTAHRTAPIRHVLANSERHTAPTSFCRSSAGPVHPAQGALWPGNLAAVVAPEPERFGSARMGRLA